jgi:uncharacterized protein
MRDRGNSSSPSTSKSEKEEGGVMPIKRKKQTENFWTSDIKSKADKGDAEAQCLLGGLYDVGQDVPQDFAQARQWWMKAASQGHAEAQYLMGGLHDIGHGVPRDYVKARQWYEKAADQGHAEAQYNLGVLYAEGLGVPLNTTKARELFEKTDTQRWTESRAA